MLTKLLWYFQAGGILMYPLLVCSLVSVAVIIERSVRLRRPRLIDPAIVENIQERVEEGEIETAIKENRDSPVLVGRILCGGLDEFVNTTADIESSLTEAGQRGLQVLYNNLSILSLVARVAPLLGLLGTVLGMIKGFAAFEVAKVGKEELARAIRIALITTATGLMIAIPTMVAGTFFRSRTRRIQAEFEEIFIDMIKWVKPSPLCPAGDRREPQDEVADRASPGRRAD